MNIYKMFFAISKQKDISKLHLNKLVLLLIFKEDNIDIEVLFNHISRILIFSIQSEEVLDKFKFHQLLENNEYQNLPFITLTEYKLFKTVKYRKISS